MANVSAGIARSGAGINKQCHAATLVAVRQLPKRRAAKVSPKETVSKRICVPVTLRRLVNALYAVFGYDVCRDRNFFIDNLTSFLIYLRLGLCGTVSQTLYAIFTRPKFSGKT